MTLTLSKKKKKNSAKKLGLSSLQMITAVLRMLIYGVSGDLIDEYVWIGETIALESLKKFVTAVIDIFFLRNTWESQTIKTLLDC